MIRFKISTAKCFPPLITKDQALDLIPIVLGPSRISLGHDQVPLEVTVLRPLGIMRNFGRDLGVE
jgi:hypothetical protein